MKTNWFARIIGIAWRGLCVGLAYLVGLMASGILLGMLGLIKPTSGSSSVSLVWLFLAAVVIGLTLGPIAQQLTVSRGRHLLIWSSIIFFNLASVMIEGAFFAPALVPIPLPALALQQLLATLVAGLAITVLFAPAPLAAQPLSVSVRRPWYDWAWRFVVSSFSYLVLYLGVGGINYNLVTQPYYATHAGGLVVPPAMTVWLIESVRAPLIVLSVLFFLLASRPGRRTTVLTGLILFMVGGVAPLLLQAGTLPTVLLVASAVEIFFQNFLAGVVAAILLGLPNKAAANLAAATI